MRTNNIYSQLPKDLSAEVFDTLSQGTNVRIERIVSLGHQTPDKSWYDQSEHEWIILLKGEAGILFANSSASPDSSDCSHSPDSPKLTTLSPGDYINIPAHTKHRVEWTDADNPTIWLAIHYT